MNRHRLEQACDRLVTNEDGDHREDNGTREARQVAELPRAEAEAGVSGVLSGVAVGQRGEQQGAGVGAHVQSVRDQGDRTEKQAAHDFSSHHDATQNDHGPRSSFASRVVGRQEDVTVRFGNLVGACFAPSLRSCLLFVQPAYFFRY